MFWRPPTHSYDFLIFLTFGFSHFGGIFTYDGNYFTWYWWLRYLLGDFPHAYLMLSGVWHGSFHETHLRAIYILTPLNFRSSVFSRKNSNLFARNLYLNATQLPFPFQSRSLVGPLHYSVYLLTRITTTTKPLGIFTSCRSVRPRVTMVVFNGIIVRVKILVGMIWRFRYGWL